MLSLVKFLILCGFVAIAVSWMVNQEGITVISWAGWQFEMMTNVLISAQIMFILILYLLYRGWTMIINWPSMLSHNWQARRKSKGDRALGLGMVAFAAGDHTLARKQARKAEKILGSGILPDLLSAQAAHAAGDEKAALKYFLALSKQTDTAYFGHIGLMRLQQSKGAGRESISEAKLALSIQPQSIPAMLHLLGSDLQRKDWSSALDRLIVLMARKDIHLADQEGGGGLVTGQLNRPELLAAHLCLFLSKTEDEAIIRLEQALKFAPDFIEAAVRLAKINTDQKPRLVLKRLEKNFKAAPHLQLAKSIAQISGDNPGQLIARLAALADKAKRPDDAKLTVAKMALDNEIWSSASAALSAVSPEGQTNQYFLLQAKLAEKKEEFGDALSIHAQTQARQSAMMNAAHAPHGSSWHCRACGLALKRWQVKCTSCPAIGQVDWCLPILPGRVMRKLTKE